MQLRENAAGSGLLTDNACMEIHRPVPGTAGRASPTFHILVPLTDPRYADADPGGSKQMRLPLVVDEATALPTPPPKSAITSPATPHSLQQETSDVVDARYRSGPLRRSLRLSPSGSLHGDELLDKILRHAEWLQALGAGAVGLVLLSRWFPQVAIKVSLYETGFRTALFMHPTRSEPAMMRLLMRTLLVGRATPHLPVLFGERHDVPLSTLRIPEAFWRSSTAATELRQWIERRQNCDPERCSILCMERFTGGTLFHALCRGTAPGIDISAVRELTFQIVFTLAVLLRFHPNWKHNDLSLANVMLRRRGSLTTACLGTCQVLVGLAGAGARTPASTLQLVRPSSAPEAGPVRYRRYAFEGHTWYLGLRPEQPYEAVIADFDFACIEPLISNAKVDFFERQSRYHCYRINSERDWYGDIQMRLSNLREVVQHLIRRRWETQRPSGTSALSTSVERGAQDMLLPEERDAVEFFERCVHPNCRDTADRSLRGRLPPNTVDLDERYNPIHMLLFDPYFDPFLRTPEWGSGAMLEASYAWPIECAASIDANGASHVEGAGLRTHASLWSASSPIRCDWEHIRGSWAADGA